MVAEAIAVPRQATPRRMSERTRRGLAAWGFALPFLAVFGAFMAGPVVASLGMSFTDMRGTDMRDPLGVNVIGLDNYVRLLHDELFLQSLRNTAIFVAGSVP